MRKIEAQMDKELVEENINEWFLFWVDTVALYKNLNQIAEKKMGSKG